MSKGYVYVLRNPSMPGILKIGRTERSVAQRANELWQTGVPTPFQVAYEVFSPDCVEMELRAHEKFHDQRVNASREFFRVEVSEVMQHLDNDLRWQVECLVDEFIPDQTIVDTDYFVDISALRPSVYEVLRDAFHPSEVVDVLYHVEGADILPAVERQAEAARKRQQEAKSLRIVGAS